jgi:hypothetical protein
MKTTADLTNRSHRQRAIRKGAPREGSVRVAPVLPFPLYLQRIDELVGVLPSRAIRPYTGNHWKL